MAESGGSKTNQGANLPPQTQGEGKSGQVTQVLVTSGKAGKSGQVTQVTSDDSRQNASEKLKKNTGANSTSQNSCGRFVSQAVGEFDKKHREEALHGKAFASKKEAFPLHGQNMENPALNVKKFESNNPVNVRQQGDSTKATGGNTPAGLQTFTEKEDGSFLLVDIVKDELNQESLQTNIEQPAFDSRDYDVKSSNTMQSQGMPYVSTTEENDLTRRCKSGMTTCKAVQGFEISNEQKQAINAGDSAEGIVSDMQVFVITSDKKKVVLQVKPEDLIATVKEKVNDKLSCDKDYDIYWNGGKLEEKQTVKSCNIQPDSELMITKRRKKGGNDKGRHCQSTIETSDEPKQVLHETDATKAEESDEESDDEQPTFENDFNDSTGNPLVFSEGLLTDKACSEGSSLKLTCSVNKQDMKAKWYKNGKVLEQNERITQTSKDLKHSLDIQNICMDDSGEYMIEIENLTAKTKVTVTENQLIFKEELVTKETLTEGLNLHLRCSVNKKDMKANWYKDRELLKQSERITQTSNGQTHNLEIKDVCVKDSGEYIVKIGNLNSKSTVIIEEKPVTVTFSLMQSKKAMKGEEVQMKCIVSKPNLKAKWTINGKEVKSDGERILVEAEDMLHKLTIRNVTKNDEGDYCLEIEGIQERTTLKVHGVKEDDDIKGADGKSTPIYNSSGRTDKIEDESGYCVNVKSSSTTGNEQMESQKNSVASNHKIDKGNFHDEKEAGCGAGADGRSYQYPSGYCEELTSQDESFGSHEQMTTQKSLMSTKSVGASTSNTTSHGNPTRRRLPSNPSNPQRKVDESIRYSGCGETEEDTAIDELTEAFERSMSIKDTEKFPFKYRFRDEKETKTKLLPLDMYMKCRFVMHYGAHLKNLADDLSRKQQIVISVENGVLLIDKKLGQKGSDCIELVLQFISSFTKNINVTGWPITGVDYNTVEKELLNSKDGSLKEIVFLSFKDKIYIACDSKVSFEVDSAVQTVLKTISVANKRNISKTFGIPYIFGKILRITNLLAHLKEENPNVGVEYMKDEDEDLLKVVFTGHEDKVSEATEHFDSNILKQNCCRSINIDKIPDVDIFSRPEELVLVYLHDKYRNETDIAYDINEKRKKVWLSSKSAQSTVDSAVNELRNIGEIVKTIKIPLDKTPSNVTEVREWIKDINDSNYTIVQLVENTIVVNGLEKYATELAKKIKQMMKDKHTMPKSGFSLVYDRFLHFVEENGTLKRLSEDNEISYSPFQNEKQEEIYFSGKETNISNFRKKLERKRNEFQTNNVQIQIGKGIERTQIDEILHTTELNCYGLVTIQKNQSNDTTAIHKKTTTVIGATLKNDLQDCLYTQWCLDSCTVTLVESTSDFQSVDVILVPVDGNSNPDFSQNVKKMTVPIPKKEEIGGKNLTGQLESYFKSKLSDEACLLVCIQSSEVNGWSNYKYVKSILRSLMDWAKESEGSKKDIVLCCCDKVAYDCCFEFCSDAIKAKNKTTKPVNKDLYLNSFIVEVRKGGIVDTKADVIVNTTNKELDLTTGAVSMAILKCAGDKLKDEVKRKKPNGIPYGEILETDACNLEYPKVILHGALEGYRDIKNLQKLEDFVSKCFNYVDSKKFTSIALPAIGTGQLQYKENEVAATMFKAAKKFFRDCHPSALRHVLFVVYDKDSSCLKAFEAEFKLWNEYLVSQAWAVVYHSVRVQPNRGSILQTFSDAVIYFWDDGKVHGSRYGTGNALTKACGKSVFDKVLKNMREKKGTVIQEKAENINADLFVMGCQNSEDSIYKATTECLLQADKCKNVTSISIVFDGTHSFLLNKKLTHYLCEAIKDISHKIHQIKQVEIMVDGEQDFKEVLNDFKLEKQGLIKLKEPIRVEVSGFEENVKEAVAKIKEQFSQLQIENGSALPMPENDKKEDKSKGTAEGNKFIEPSERFAKYVEVHNIPEGLDKVKLKLQLFKEGVFPIATPKLIYLEGRNEALLICLSEDDAKKLSLCTTLEPFVFCRVEGKALSSVTKIIDQKAVAKMRANGIFDQFKEELHHADIELKEELPFKLVAPSTFQYEYAMFIMKETSLDLQGKSPSEKYEDMSASNDGFHNITEKFINDVEEKVWDVLCHLEKSMSKDISYDKKTHTIVVEETSEDDFQKMNKFVKDLCERDWEEIIIDGKHDISTVEKWCDEVKNVIGYKCCKYIQADKKVLVFAKRYEDVLTIKHLFGVKTGKIKPTGIGRRGGKTSSGKDDKQAETVGSSQAERRSPDRKGDCKNVQKYVTKENIRVFVYEANILHLDVDCIVNAANESLQHAGGVAAVIERGAGCDLKKESNAFVRQNGNLPVGKACTTTAGNLRYNCVIHAVGPRWSDYYPHTLQDVKQCQIDLYEAVYNSFLEAERRSLKSIAFPAISSAIFGVPEEICVQQYAKATFDYSKRFTNAPYSLKEIHFIDKNSNIVKKIQDTFYSVFLKGEEQDCDPSKFVKSHGNQRGNSPGSNAGGQSNFSSSVYKQSHKAQSQYATSDVYEVTQVEPLSFFDDDSNAYAYLLHGKEEYKLLLSRGDMLKVKANAVVIPVDNQGRRGNIASYLFSKIPTIYSKDYSFKVASECRHKRLCDVFETQGYECGYPFILHAIYNAKDKDINQRKHDVQKLYKNIFNLCDTKTGIKTVVTPLLGPDVRKDSDIRTCAEMFLKSYLEYYSKPVKKKSLQVHLVCKDDTVYGCVKDVFDKYVMSKKKELMDTQGDKNTPASTPAAEQPDNLHEEENCVICLETVTDPETLNCGHTFCKECIEAQFKVKQACPTCGKVCGVITGDQPEGTMSYYIDKYRSCSGYEGCGKIVITYNFPSGRQGPEHPSPGTFYKGITRVAYLPNNEEGHKIRAMLDVAFKRKLVFTIGNSRTTGQEGVITWNDIHHKTNPRPYQQFGYPDPGYLERVKDELAVKGVTEKDIEMQ